MTNDKQRERLVELLDECCKTELGTQFYKSVLGRIADHILTDGWMRPPCKVGDMVYVVLKNMPFVPADAYEGKVVWYALGEDGLRPTVQIKSDLVIINGANLGVYLEDIFLTKEEAEEALGGVADA